jgi:hypothetical protein
MGYRSDVAYTIRFTADHDEKNKQSFYTFLAEAKARAATARCFGDGWRADVEIDETRLRINFAADDVKWYPTYLDVRCHEALIDLADEWANDESNNSEIAYRFVRIGEEPEDIEVRANGNADFDWVNVVRAIERDW